MQILVIKPTTYEKLRRALKRLAKGNVHIQGRIDADAFRLISSTNPERFPRVTELHISVRRLADKLKTRKAAAGLHAEAALLVAAINRLPENVHLSIGADLDDLKRAAQALMKGGGMALSTTRPKKAFPKYDAKAVDARASKIFRDYRGGVEPVTWNSYRNKAEGAYHVFLAELFQILQIGESAAIVIKSRVARGREAKRGPEEADCRARTVSVRER